VRAHRRPRPFAALLLLAGTALSGGCGGGSSSYVHPSIDFGYMRRATVLPFRNLTSDELADDRIQSIFLMELLEQDILEIVDTREAQAAMAAMNVRAGTELTPEQAVELGKRLSVDALFIGTVEEYGISRADRNRISEVTLVLEMVETQTGVVAWRSQVHRTGSSLAQRLFGGAPKDLYTVSRQAVVDAIGTLLE
jgi:Peptidoglycan-synthase activator LpoB